MSTALAFQSTTFDVIDRNGHPWLKASQLAQALGYAREDKVTRLYDRHADEFTDSMTQLIEIPDNPTLGVSNLITKTRIFSLRGCHLIAMLARTQIAKAFRVWVLDVLETLNKAKAIPEALTPSTADDRKPLRSLVFAWSKVAGVHVDTCWPQVKAYFQLSRMDDLPVEWIPDALTFVQGKIDAMPRALPKPEPLALPSPDLDLTHYFDAMQSHSRHLLREYSDMVVALKTAYLMNWNRQFDRHSPDHAVLPMLDMVGNFAGILDGTLRAIQNHAEAFARVKRL